MNFNISLTFSTVNVLYICNVVRMLFYSLALLYVLYMLLEITIFFIFSALPIWFGL